MLTEGYAETKRRRVLGGAFWTLWWGETCSMVGTQVTAFAVPVIAVLTLGATPWQMGLMTASGTLAVLLLSLPFGALVDRHDRLRTLIWSGFARAAVISVLPAALLLGRLSVWLICCVAFVNGALDILHSTAFASLVPAIVPDDELERANGLLETSEATGEVLGPAAAGVVTQVLAPAWTLATDSISYLVAASFAIVTARTAPAAGAVEEPEGGHEPVLTAARRGFHDLRQHQTLWPMTQAAAIFNLCTAAFFTLFVLYEIRELGLRPVQIGAIAALAGAGGIAGSLIAPRLTRRSGPYRALVLAYAVPAAAAIGCTAVPPATPPGVSTSVIGAFQFVWVAAIVVNLVVSTSFLQKHAPSRMLGRFIATTRFVSWGVEPLGAVAAGAAAALIGSTRLVLLIAGAGLALGVLPIVGARTAIEGNTDDLDI